MLNVTKTDLDAACAAYGRATGDSPRREGIRVALHSYRQLTSDERVTVFAACEVLNGAGFPLGAHTILKLLGLNKGEEQ